MATKYSLAPNTNLDVYDRDAVMVFMDHHRLVGHFAIGQLEGTAGTFFFPALADGTRDYAKARQKLIPSADGSKLMNIRSARTVVAEGYEIMNRRDEELISRGKDVLRAERLSQDGVAAFSVFDGRF